MTLPRETVLELMALADGELAGEAKARAERAVAQSEEARLLVEGFRRAELAPWLAGALEPRSADADGIADAVMAKVVRESAKQAGGPRHPNAGMRGAGAAPAAFAALALAAGVAMFFQGASAPVGEAPTATTPAVPGPYDEGPPPSAVAKSAPAPPEGVQIEEIDSPARDVSVFAIPVGPPANAAARAAATSSVVIMIEDDPGRK